MAIAKLQGSAGQSSVMAATPVPADDGNFIDQAIAASPAYLSAVATSFGIVVVAAIAGWVLYRYSVKPLDFIPSSKYVPLAGLFVLAFAVERVLEPLSGFILPSTAKAKAQRDQQVAIAHNENRMAGADPAAMVASDLEKVSAALAEAAKSQEQVDRLRASRGVVMWGMAAGISIIVSACLGFFLLRSLSEAPGTTSASNANAPAKETFPKAPRDPNRFVDLVITGLVVGAGTKPLHDLVSSLQASKDSRTDPTETAKKAT